MIGLSWGLEKPFSAVGGRSKVEAFEKIAKKIRKTPKQVNKMLNRGNSLEKNTNSKSQRMPNGSSRLASQGNMPRNLKITCGRINEEA